MGTSVELSSEKRTIMARSSIDSTPMRGAAVQEYLRACSDDIKAGSKTTRRRIAMDLDDLRKLLAWCTLINWVLLILWFAGYSIAGNWIYGIHSKMFKISKETFDAFNYGGMGLYKLVIVVFNFIPYLVLQLFFT